MLFSSIEFIGFIRVVVVLDLNFLSWLFVLMKIELIVLMWLCILLGVFNCMRDWWMMMLIMLVVLLIVSIMKVSGKEVVSVKVIIVSLNSVMVFSS